MFRLRELEMESYDNAATDRGQRGVRGRREKERGRKREAGAQEREPENPRLAKSEALKCRNRIGTRERLVKATKMPATPILRSDSWAFRKLYLAAF